MKKFDINKCIVKMESNDELKEINIKNGTRYYVDGIIKTECFDFDNIGRKLTHKILVRDNSYKVLIVAKPLRIKIDKVDRFIIVFDETRNLVLFRSEKDDLIYNRIRYLIGVKGGITYATSHNYSKIKVDSYDSLPLEKTLAFHNVIIHINLLCNKDQSHYC